MKQKWLLFIISLFILVGCQNLEISEWNEYVDLLEESLAQVAYPTFAESDDKLEAYSYDVESDAGYVYVLANVDSRIIQLNVYPEKEDYWETSLHHKENYMEMDVEGETFYVNDKTTMIYIVLELEEAVYEFEIYEIEDDFDLDSFLAEIVKGLDENKINNTIKENRKTILKHANVFDITDVEVKTIGIISAPNYVEIKLNYEQNDAVISAQLATDQVDLLYDVEDLYTVSTIEHNGINVEKYERAVEDATSPMFIYMFSNDNSYYMFSVENVDDSFDDDIILDKVSDIKEAGTKQKR